MGEGRPESLPRPPPTGLLLRAGTAPRYRYDGEHTLFLTDWYHTIAASLAMPLNRWVGGRAGSWELAGMEVGVMGEQRRERKGRSGRAQPQGSPGRALARALGWKGEQWMGPNG